MEYQASILCIGTELVQGKHMETNGYYLSQQLSRLGIKVREIILVPDDRGLLKAYITQSLKKSHLVITTGGLGPTPDDLTKEVVRDVLHLKYEYSPRVYAGIEKYFRKRGRMVPLDKVQAYIFPHARTLTNKAGTAPGFLITRKKKVLVLLPGPPLEMKLMFESSVSAYLKKHFRVRFHESVLRMYGLGESFVAEKVEPFEKAIQELSGEVIYLSSPDLVDIIVKAKKNIPVIKKMVLKIKALFPAHIYSEKWESLYEVVARELARRKLTLSLAESCTGGLISKVITDRPGSSCYFLFGVVCYSNQSKEKILNVRRSTLEHYGAVSCEAAREMLDGLSRIKKTDISVAITGTAGPSGGTKEKPAGTVWIAIRYKRSRIVKKYNFTGTREKIRENALNKVFELIHTMIHDPN